MLNHLIGDNLVDLEKKINSLGFEKIVNVTRSSSGTWYIHFIEKNDKKEKLKLKREDIDGKRSRT